MPKNLQIYRLYETTSPTLSDVYFLVLDFNDDVIKGIMFFKDTLEMDCLFEIKKDFLYLQSVDYIYDKDSKFILKLINRGTDDS